MPHQPNHNTRLFRVTARFILIGLIAFSIIRNIRGLDIEFAGVNFWWQVMIAITITLASSVLTGSSVVIQSEAYVRWLLFLCGLMFSTVSFFLSYSGAVADMQGKYLKIGLRDPQVVQLLEEIDDIIDRVNAYGLSERQKLSLMQREKELRSDLRKARERATVQAQNQSRKQELNITGIALFAVLPEIGIITFTIVIVLLSGEGMSLGTSGGSVQGRQDIIVAGAYHNQNPQETETAEAPVSAPGTTSGQIPQTLVATTNGRHEPAALASHNQPDTQRNRWSPFG